jgi:hypothetical protein
MGIINTVLMVIFGLWACRELVKICRLVTWKFDFPQPKAAEPKKHKPLSDGEAFYYTSDIGD